MLLIKENTRLPVSSSIPSSSSVPRKLAPHHPQPNHSAYRNALKASEHSSPHLRTSEETYVQTPYSSHPSAHEAHTSPHSYSSQDYNEANSKRITPASPHHKESSHNQRSAAQAYQQSPDYSPSPSQLTASKRKNPALRRLRTS